MNPSRLDHPCILFALRRESAPFRRRFPPQDPFPGSPCGAQFCGPVVLVETGVGQEKVARALDWLFEKPQWDGVPYEPRLLVFAGFAGALTDDLHIGDIVVAEEVVDLHGQSWRTTWPGPVSATAPLQRGRLLTVDKLTATPDDKRRLAKQHQAIAVEMESAVFAARCTQAGIPFGCVRVISDEAASSLSPALVSMLSGGKVSVWRMLLALARRPFLLPELLRLARDTKKASEQLALALGELLPLG